MGVLGKSRVVSARPQLMQQGDVLSRAEFERRYAAMPHLKKAELIAEIAASSASYDLHQKKRIYHRAGVKEYLVWIADENRLVWWRMEDDEFVEIPADDDGLMASLEFPGLVMDAAALTTGDLAKALERLG